MRYNTALTRSRDNQILQNMTQAYHFDRFVGGHVDCCCCTRQPCEDNCRGLLVAYIAFVSLVVTVMRFVRLLMHFNPGRQASTSVFDLKRVARFELTILFTRTVHRPTLLAIGKGQLQDFIAAYSSPSPP
jgi:hypothetical protein